LTEAEYAASLQASAGDGMSISRWFVGLARVRLFGEAQFGRPEIEALSRSSQLLLALARSVNQIAHTMERRVDSDRLSLAQIDHLLTFLKSHTDAVSGVLHANSKRWLK
jgi:hypothetical protein